nr:hypothetical protein [Tanacetum cinerariifolium]
MIRKQVGDLSLHSTKYSSPALTQKVFANMRRVGKGFSGVDIPLFEGMLVAQQVNESAAKVNVDDVPAAVDEPIIPLPTSHTQPPPPSQDQPSTSQVQPTPPESPQAQPLSPQQQPQPSQDAKISMDLFYNLLDICTSLTRRVENLEQDKIAQALEITKLKQRVKKLERRNKLKVLKLRRLKKDVVDIAKEVAVDAKIKESADDDEVELAELQEVVEVVTTAKLITEVVTAASATITGMTYDDIRLIFEKKFNSNVAFLEKTREQMEEEDSKALKRISGSQEDKVAKKQKLDEEVEELRKHPQIVPNDDDDVYTEAIPFALTVPVIDYEIYTENNKPYYKIKRADETHQPYLSFLSMLRNFDREDLEVLWQLVKERFASSKPKNFLDDFLLTTLGAIFKKPDIQAQI